MGTATCQACLSASQGLIWLKLICGYSVFLFLAVLSAILLKMVWYGDINLDALVSEVNGQASASRFQLVIFTVIIALSLFLLTIQDGQFPAISHEILILLGISSSTYAVGKGISYSQPDVMTAAGNQQAAKDISATGAAVIATPGGIASSGATNPVEPSAVAPAAAPAQD